MTPRTTNTRNFDSLYHELSFHGGLICAKLQDEKSYLKINDIIPMLGLWALQRFRHVNARLTPSCAKQFPPFESWVQCRPRTL